VTSLAALCQRLAEDVRYERQRSTTTANLVAESSTRVAEMDISHGLIRDYMRRRPLSPVDLTVEIREEDEELLVPESPVWDRVSVDEEIDPNDIGDDLREAAIAAPPSDEVVIPAVGGPIIMRLRDGMLGERLRTMGELEMDSDVDVALGEMMPADVQVAPLVEIRDFAAEEEEQARHKRGRADEEANALADRLVREGRAPIPYAEDGGDDALPEAEYNTPPEYSQ